jgi:hypothetical protein
MNISDEQLDRMIEAAKHEVGEMNNMLDIVTDTRNHDYYGGRLADASALLHILETYRDMPKTADGWKAVTYQNEKRDMAIEQVDYGKWKLIRWERVKWVNVVVCDTAAQAAEAAKARET